MSLELREKLVKELYFTNDSQKADLLDPKLTDTYLIALLWDLVNRCPKGILITAVRTDHPTYDGGPNGHGHNAGKAVDLWTDSSDDNDVLEVIEAVVKNQYIWTCGLGGSSKRFASYVTWPPSPFILFMDNDTPHIHLQCANEAGQGIRV